MSFPTTVHLEGPDGVRYRVIDDYPHLRELVLVPAAGGPTRRVSYSAVVRGEYQPLYDEQDLLEG